MRVNVLFILFTLLSFNITSVIARNEFAEFIKQVQINSQQSYDEINSASFKGHSKTYIYFAYNPFLVKMIPLMDEYYFDGFWMKPDSLRIVVTAQRKITADSSDTGEIAKNFPLPNPFLFLYNASVIGIADSDTSEESQQFWPLYPFAIGADSVYHYEKIHEIGFGDNRVLTVSVTPTQENIPAVSGTFQIDANKHVVVGSNVIFNEAATFINAAAKKERKKITLSISGSENHRIKTHKELLYGKYWLPTMVEEDFDIKFWGITVKANRIIEFENYVVDPVIEDTAAIVNQKVTYKPEPELERKLFADVPHPDRLTKQEREQLIGTIENQLASVDLYKDLFESQSLARQAMKLGMEQRFGRYVQWLQNLGNYVLYNRVEGIRLSYGINLSNMLTKNSAISLSAGYGISDERRKAHIGVLQFFDSRKKFFADANIYNTTGYEEDRQLITTGKNTFISMLYKGDYRDYYYKTGGSIGLGYRATDNMALKLSVVSHTEERAKTNTKFSILNYNNNFRLNPEIKVGIFRGLRALFIYKKHHVDANIVAEYTNHNQLRSDYSYAFIKANLLRSFNPTYHSKFTVYTSAAISYNNLPPQRWFDFGGRTFLNYYGNLRGVNYKEFTGDRMVYGTLEYAIKGTEFYDRGLQWNPIKAVKLTLWAGLGWSSLSANNKNLFKNVNTPTNTADDIYYEIGIGFGDALNIFRIDFTHNSISKNRIEVGVNVLQ